LELLLGDLMSDIFADLEERARQLPVNDRARLALALIESLEPADEGDIAEAWRVEAERRCRQIDRGEVKLIPAAEAFDDVRRSLK